MKKWLANIAAVIWFFTTVMGVLLLMPATLLMIPSNISLGLKTGFGTQAMGFAMLMISGFALGITMLVPAFRKCFRKLPWLYPYATILTMDITILAIAETIFNYGYSVQNETRHTVFLILMILQIVVCRIAMCIYCYRKPMWIKRDEYEQ